jgi:PAS domain S-box-containing protein
MKDGGVEVAAAADGGTGRGSGSATLFDPMTLISIADSLPLMIAYVDRDQRYRFINKPFAEWFEKPRSEIIGRTMREVSVLAAHEWRRTELEAALAGERQFFATVVEHPTRGTLAIQVDYVPQVLPSGEVAGAIIVVQDVTEQRATEVALRESEARFRRIADSAPLPMWVTRIDRTRDFVNDAYVAMMGVSREEARKTDWMSRMHRDDRQRVIEETLAGEASGGEFAIEGRFAMRPGDFRWMHAVSSPRLDADGRIVGYIGVASDITVIKEAELELRRLVEERTAELSESEQRFRAIFDTVLEVIVLMKPDGTVLEVNRTQAGWRASDPSEAVGGKLWDSPTFQRHPEHREFTKQAAARAAAGETVRTELAMHGEGGASATLDVSLRGVRDEHDRIIYLLLEARDVTDLKLAQEQLRQSQKMEALGQLTGGIAHDFNNLLTVVVGGLDMISKKVTDEKLLRYATNALAAAERGVRLTGQLLTFSRSQRLEVRPCLLAPLVEEMMPLLRNVLGPGIEKRFDLDELQMPVMGDPTQIEVAVLNLAINARDAMPHGGTLSFISRGVRIDEDPELDPGDYVELVVSDTGTGMPPEVAARVFEPFFTTKEVGKGTGLGLSMVYGMARQSGGTARIASEPGKGTSVSLFFRKADKAGERESVASVRGELAESKLGARVVVIDDDPDVRGFIVTSLAEFGYQVEEAADGPSGIALVEKVSPDVVVIDYVMPGMSGAEVASAILATRPDQALLFVSGYSETDDIKRAAPNAALLAKPFRPDALDAAVRSALAGSRDAMTRGASLT